MNKKKKNIENSNDWSILFFIIPTLMLVFGYFAIPYPIPDVVQQIVLFPLFIGLVFLGVGYFWKDRIVAGKIKIVGWIVFSFFWSTMPKHLYLSEGGDVFNGVVCVLGVYVLMYIAYHEWLSLKKKEDISCLNWIAGGSFIAGIVYFSLDFNIVPFLRDGLIEVVASHSNILLNLLGIETVRNGPVIVYNTPITIIFACTAIQAMVLFVGMIGAISGVSIKRKLVAIIITVTPMYFLNLVRNASVIYLVGADITSFHVAHNILSKAGALITLIVLLLVAFKLIPELYDEINCIFDLSKRNGPFERFISNIISGKKGK